MLSQVIPKWPGFLCKLTGQLRQIRLARRSELLLTQHAAPPLKKASFGRPWSLLCDMQVGPVVCGPRLTERPAMCLVRLPLAL